MAKTTNIQWTDATWNVARGCNKVDAGCKHCYMFRDSFNGKRYDPAKVIRTKTVFDLPLKLKKPSKIFTSSLTDFFHSDIDVYRNEAWDIIRKCPQHIFQILTKRPDRIPENLPDDWGEGWKNVWLGTSVCDNKGLWRVEKLVEVPAFKRFVSFEPLLEEININFDISTLIEIDWAIIGGESGNDNGNYRYRRCELEWIESLASQLAMTQYIFIKQLGTYLAKNMNLKDRHGRNMEEFPERLQLREFPKV